jgi:hypothetical protein
MAKKNDVSLTMENKEMTISHGGHAASIEPSREQLSGHDRANGDNGSLEPCPNGDGIPDPFDLRGLRISQDFESGIGVKKLLTTIPVRKPLNESFVQVHPSEDYRTNTYVIELKDEREIYWVAQGLWPQLAHEPTFSPRALFTAVTRQGDPFLWPIRLPAPDGRIDSYNASALEAAQRAMRSWVRVAANIGLKAYNVWEATAPLPPPIWPEKPFRELLRIAFRGKVIETADHPVLRKLRGEA